MKTLSQRQEIFDALTDTTRLRMVHLLLAMRAAICQCEFVDSLEISPANISRHAKILVQADLIAEHREGKWVYYQLTTNESALRALLSQTHDAVLDADRQRFQKRVKLREGGKCLIGAQKMTFR